MAEAFLNDFWMDVCREEESGLGVPADSPIHTAKDLTGKTIAISGLRGITEIGTRNWLDKNGGDSNSIKLLDMPFPAMADALTQHRVDAALITQPYLEAALETKKVRLVADVYAARRTFCSAGSP